jgi:hypothetical protein
VREGLRRACLPGARAAARSVVRPGRLRAPRPRGPRPGRHRSAARRNGYAAAAQSRDDCGLASSDSLLAARPRCGGNGDPLGLPLAARARKRWGRDAEDARALTCRAPRRGRSPRGAGDPAARSCSGKEGEAQALGAERRGPTAGLGAGAAERSGRGREPCGSPERASERGSESVAAARFSPVTPFSVLAVATTATAVAVAAPTPATAVAAPNAFSTCAHPGAGCTAPGGSEHDRQGQGVQARARLR